MDGTFDAMPRLNTRNRAFDANEADAAMPPKPRACFSKMTDA
ncbi:hypothetical protein [Burkholderia sp. Bp9140]|nr:hypothetical protein [Burkholderia sp. Bp9140]